MRPQLREVLKTKKFIVTAEVAPPKGVDLARMIEHIEHLKDKVDAINVTDHQSSVMRYPSLGACLLIKEKGGEPVLQMTCRDRNRLALEADLLFAYQRGIKNVLALTGDAISLGDHKEAKSVFDLDSVQLIETIRKLESGADLSGSEIEGKVEFCVGAVVTPEANPLEPQLLKFEKKIEVGAEFFQTQAVYDLDKFKIFMDYARKFKAKILAGIVLITSPGMAKYMNKNVSGVVVPQNLIKAMEAVDKPDRLKKGIEIAADLIRKIKKQNLCDGVHIMAIGKEEVVPEILAQAGLT